MSANEKPREFTAEELANGPDDFPYTTLEDMEAFRAVETPAQSPLEMDSGEWMPEILNMVLQRLQAYLGPDAIAPMFYDDAITAVAHRAAFGELPEAMYPEGSLLHRLRDAEAKLASAEREAGALREPDTYWLSDDPEVGYNSIEEFGDAIDVGEVARLNVGHMLPDQWAAHVCIPATETSGEDSEIQLFATEAEARAAIDAARALPTTEGTENAK